MDEQQPQSGGTTGQAADRSAPPTEPEARADGAVTTDGAASGDDATDDGAATRRPRPSFGRRLAATVREFAVVVVLALALSFVVKTWLVQAFYIPSQSMEDTLVVNDRVLVNHLVPERMDLHRGDVVVFSDPDNWLDPGEPVDHGAVLNVVTEVATFVGLLPDPSDDHLIKRVIGLPGDHVVCCDPQQRLVVNGVAIDEPYLKPGSVASTSQFDIRVPAGRIWVMGDNRGNSQDSRFHDPKGDGSEGSVPLTKVTGRAFALVWPVNHIAWLGNYSPTFAGVPAEAPSTPSPTTTTTP